MDRFYLLKEKYVMIVIDEIDNFSMKHPKEFNSFLKLLFHDETDLERNKGKPKL